MNQQRKSSCTEVALHGITLAHTPEMLDSLFEALVSQKSATPLWRCIRLQGLQVLSVLHCCRSEPAC